MLKNLKGAFYQPDTSTLLRLLPSIMFIIFYTAGVYYIEHDILRFDFKPTSTVFSLLGIVLGLLLVFRTNTAYERWWEGRRIWGGMVDATRNLSIKLNAYLPENDEENRRFFATMIPNYAFAVKEHLREGVDYNELVETYPGLFEDLKKYKHVPNRINSLIYKRIHELAEKKVITQEQLLALDKLADVLTQTTGGCERIKNTPIPKSYSKHLDRFVLLYTLILPFGFMHDLGYWTVPTIVIIYFALEGIKNIGEEIEDPFGRDTNDLPTDSISNGIKSAISEILLGVK